MSTARAFLVSVLLAAPAAAEPGRYMISFQSGAGAADRARALRALGSVDSEWLAPLGLALAEVADTSRVQALSGEELDDLKIGIIEEDAYRDWISWLDFPVAVPRFQPSAVPPPAALPVGVAAHEVPWGVRRVNAASAWGVTEGAGVKVAVLDTGIDGAHPDLHGQVAGGFNAVDESAPWFDDHRHGTHVAGTIAARKDGRGVVGVAPGASLYAVKVLDRSGSGRIFTIIKGLVWCVDNGVHVANMSLSAPMGSVFLRLAVKYAGERGVVVVVAAGNAAGGVGYPAAYDQAIAVAASDDRDQLADFSNRGAKVEFIAPGVDVNSTVPNGRHETMSGTSMAAPHVAGLAALAVARGASGVAGVRAALTRAAKPIGLPAAQQGKGLVDAALLVR